MKLLLDEMLSPRIAETLRTEGADVLSISESPALRATPDPDVLELAAREQRVLVTDNIKDFGPINRIWAAQGRTHAGILFVSVKTFPQDRSRIGRVSIALAQRLAGGRWPAPGQADFL
jgi:hypothetical protein